MSDQDEPEAVPQEVVTAAERLVAEEDFVLLWQEQFLSIRSELKAVIDTQKTFETGLKGLGSKLPELVGELPTELLPEIQSSIGDAESAVEEVRRHEAELAELRTQIKAWAERLRKSPMVFSQDIVDSIPVLTNQVQKLPDLQGTFPAFMEKMQQADASAEAMQKEILAKVTEVCQAVTKRLEFETDGTAESYKKVKELAEKTVENVGWFLSKISFGLIGEEQVTMAKVGVQTLANVVKESHLQVNIAWAEDLGINDLLDKMGPFAVYRSNLVKLKDALGAGLDVAGLTGMIPGVGEALGKTIGVVKTVVTKAADGQLEETAALEEELTDAYEKLKQGGKEPTKKETEELKKRTLSVGGKLDLLWASLKDEVKGVQDSWNDEARAVFRELCDKGVTGVTTYIQEKAMETIAGTITRVLAQLLPDERPEAVFNFEIADILKTLVVEKSSDFTTDEKDELAALSG